MSSSNKPFLPTSAEINKDLDDWKLRINRVAADPQIMNQTGEQEWSNGFWDCFSPGSLCLLTCCCRMCTLLE
jgi:hypothetical protein